VRTVSRVLSHTSVLWPVRRRWDVFILNSSTINCGIIFANCIVGTFVIFLSTNLNVKTSKRRLHQTAPSPRLHFLLSQSPPSELNFSVSYEQRTRTIKRDGLRHYIGYCKITLKKIEWGILHNKTSKNVYLSMCLETLHLLVTAP
jgi:hypothetical protein